MTNERAAELIKNEMRCVRMNYKNMWKELEKCVEDNINYYKDGDMCSIQESIWGQASWEEMKAKMEEIKKKEVKE